MRLKWSALLVLCALIMLVRSIPLRAGEDVPLHQKDDMPDDASQDDKDFAVKVQADKAKEIQAMKDGYAKLGTLSAELRDKREKSLDVSGKAEVTVDDQTIPVNEPKNSEEALSLQKPVRDAYEISPDDFQISTHDIWSINASDFKIDKPQYITVDKIAGHSTTYFGFSFTITNTTAKPRRISPTFTAVTSKGVYNVAVTGLMPERMIADSMYRPSGATSIADREMLGQHIMPLESFVALGTEKLDPETGLSVPALDSGGATFLPGQTRTGVALWTNFSNEFTELKIVVSGLTNAHHYSARLVPTATDLPKVSTDGESMRRVLVLTFERLDDEFDVHRSELKYKDKRFEYVWMWDQDITIPPPADAKDPQLKVQNVKIGNGAERLMWGFPFNVRNSSHLNQTFSLVRISSELHVEVDVGGTKIPVDVRTPDDGTSTVYKSQFLRTLQKESPRDRFENKSAPEDVSSRTDRRKFTFEPGKGVDGDLWSVFDSSDISWVGVKMQVERALTTALDKKAVAKDTWEKVAAAIDPNNKDLAARNPGFMYDPRRRLTPEEFDSVKDQVLKALPGALDAAKAKKMINAWVDANSDLASGNYHISRSYKLVGVVDDAWLKAWEELDNDPAK